MMHLGTHPSNVSAVNDMLRKRLEVIVVVFVWCAFIYMVPMWIHRRADPDVAGTGAAYIGAIRKEMSDVSVPESVVRIPEKHLDAYKDSFAEVMDIYTIGNATTMERVVAFYRMMLEKNKWQLLRNEPGNGDIPWACKGKIAFYFSPDERVYGIRMRWSWAGQKDTCNH